MRQLGVPHQLGLPNEHVSTAELRFVNKDGHTECWIFKLNSGVYPDQMLKEMVDRDKVWVAYLDTGVDSRLGNQAAAIDRLTRHLAAHHDDLQIVTAKECNFMREQEETKS